MLGQWSAELQRESMISSERTNTFQGFLEIVG